MKIVAVDPGLLDQGAAVLEGGELVRANRPAVAPWQTPGRALGHHAGLWPLHLLRALLGHRGALPRYPRHPLSEISSGVRGGERPRRRLTIFDAGPCARALASRRSVSRRSLLEGSERA